ncbi:MAG: dTMP kinase [Armatimonadaceae bacterium]
MSGLFLTFEGPEGAGKTTQIALLEAALIEAGIRVTRTREPGGDRVGEKVRELLLTGEMGAEAELLLFAAARAQNVCEVVRPALEAGHIVLCDRFTDSTLAYQGYGRGLDLDLIREINRFATGNLIPDRTFLLDLPPQVGLARQDPDAQNRLDRESLTFHERVRQGFLDAATWNPERIVTLDATRATDEVQRELWQAVRFLYPDLPDSPNINPSKINLPGTG